jgi:hypothetical protein
MLSLVPDFGRRYWSELDQFDLAAVKRKTVRALREAGVKLAFGGVDFSMNIDFDVSAPYLQTQFILFVPRASLSDQKALRRCRRAMGAATPSSCRLQRTLRRPTGNGDEKTRGRS